MPSGPSENTLSQPSEAVRTLERAASARTHPAKPSVSIPRARTSQAQPIYTKAMPNLVPKIVARRSKASVRAVTGAPDLPGLASWATPRREGAWAGGPGPWPSVQGLFRWKRPLGFRGFRKRGTSSIHDSWIGGSGSDLSL